MMAPITPTFPQPLFRPDPAALLARSDLFVRGPVYFGPEGIPVGNGRLGGPLWQPDARTLAMQVNHTDVFMYHDASAASGPRSGALGRIRIDLGGDVFGDDMTQHLALYTGQMELRAGDVQITVTASYASDALLIRLEDRRSVPQPLTVSLEMLRPALVKQGDHTALSELSCRESAAMLCQRFSETCDTGIAVNDHLCRTALALRFAEEAADIRLEENRALLTLPARQGTRTLVIGGYAACHGEEDAAAQALHALADSLDFDAAALSARAWWADFWRKSHVYLPGHPGFEQRRNYFLYLMAIAGRGQYPCKYNGGLWIAEGDRRDWGCWYWNWNQDSLFQPLLDAGCEELLTPMFRMREECRAQYETAARQLWGSEGLFIGETSGILGFETLPEDVAADLRAYYTGAGPLTQRLENFGQRRNSFLTPWNWKLSRDRVSYVSHTLVATQETAEYFWMKYRYTGDTAWLRDHAYPFIRGTAELYRTYPGFVLEEDGKYHFHCTNLHEHLWGARDVIDDLALARGIFTVAIAAARILGLDEPQIPLWQDCLDRLAPYPTSQDEDVLGYAAHHAAGKLVWGQARKPAASIRSTDCIESPQFKMLERFDLLNLETRDQGLDEGQWPIALDTYLASPGYRIQYLEHGEDKNGSSRFLTDVARLGRGDDLAVMLFSQFQQFTDTPNLLHNEGDYYSAEGHGAWAAAIQSALHQSIAPLPDHEPVIRPFPAWPHAWDACYRLAAKGGFSVCAAMTGGEVRYVEIDSRLGQPCRIRSPWKGDIDLYRSGALEGTLHAGPHTLLCLDTQPGEHLLLVQAGQNPLDFLQTDVLPVEPVYRRAVVTDPNHESRRWGV